jgi:hypothetical protein
MQKKETINSELAPNAIGSYSQAIKILSFRSNPLRA